MATTAETSGAASGGTAVSGDSVPDIPAGGTLAVEGLVGVAGPASGHIAPPDKFGGIAAAAAAAANPAFSFADITGPPPPGSVETAVTAPTAPAGGRPLINLTGAAGGATQTHGMPSE